jgi:1A family penicillin-binding protein
MSSYKKHLKKYLLVFLILVLFATSFGLIYFIKLVGELPHPEKINDLQPVQSTKIYDRTGEILLYEIHGSQNRTVVSSADIPDHVKKAVVAVEDQGFYNHSAIDIKGTIRALIVNLMKGKFLQGGSTITQQLAKNVFLTSEKTISRKIKELILAYWIEKQYSKDEIITFYLNQVNFGSNIYGIEAASNQYFNVSAKDLTIAQAAILASLIQAPSYYSPWGKNVNELMKRKDLVLERMKSLGFINNDQYLKAKSEKISFQPPSKGSIKAPHFVMMVRDYLINKYGEEVVENGGLKVITTLDWDLQEKAEKAVEEGAKRNSELYKGKNAALVAQDPKTGQIWAMVGSADYFNKDIDGNFNVATQGLRQPGSAFKPFVYLTALMKGYTPDTIVFDVPTEFAANNPNCPIIVDYNNNNKSCFHPKNFDERFRGPITLKQALAQSLNIPSVKVLYLSGIENAVSVAQKMGINTLSTPDKYGLALVLGGGAVKLSEMVNAYSVFSQDGVKHQQSIILEVYNNKGDLLEKYVDNAQQVIDSQYIRTINKILSDVQLRSGLFQSSLNLTIFDGYEVALKTGTTNDYRDAWVIGYTPFIVVGVWAGNSDYAPMQRSGGSVLAAVPIWSNFLRNVINRFPQERFSEPEPISSTKPMLNGQYINVIQKENGESSPQIHNILYYVNKDNPQEEYSFPNPGNDPQFNNWEIPVIQWAQSNIPDFIQNYNK